MFFQQVVTVRTHPPSPECQHLGLCRLRHNRSDKGVARIPAPGGAAEFGLFPAAHSHKVSLQGVRGETQPMLFSRIRWKAPRVIISRSLIRCISQVLPGGQILGNALAASLASLTCPFPRGSPDVTVAHQRAVCVFLIYSVNSI